MWSQTHPPSASATTSPDGRAARLAAGQWGVLTLDNLRACELTYRQIQGSVRQAIPHPRSKGVYAWGHHTIAGEGRFLAAVLASGPYAGLPHYPAASMHALV